MGAQELWKVTETRYSVGIAYPRSSRNFSIVSIRDLTKLILIFILLSISLMVSLCVSDQKDFSPWASEFLLYLIVFK